MEKWIVTCNLAHYNIFSAFEKAPQFYWPQSVSMKKGDRVYLYVAHPYHRLFFETEIIEDQIQSIETIDETVILDREQFEAANSYMLLKVRMAYDDERLHYRNLEENGLNTVRRPSIVQAQVATYIEIVQSDIVDEQERRRDANYIYAVNEMIEEGNVKTTAFDPYPMMLPEKVWDGDRAVYPREALHGVHALKRAHYQCEIDECHPTFNRIKSGLPYTEPHHLIPLSAQQSFIYTLDIEANIVSLCSNCHTAIHNARERHELVRKLYEKRQVQLGHAGIDLSLDRLLEMYR